MSNFIDQIREIQKQRLALEKAVENAKKKKKGKNTELIQACTEDLAKYMTESQATLEILQKKIGNSLGINQAKFRDESNAYEDAERMHLKQQESQQKIIDRFEKNVGVFTEELAYITDLLNPTKQPKAEVAKEE